MRQVTATEKYNAVLEGKMAKREFVRQMRQTYPMYISQYDGFDSAVQILKNRQMIFEAQKPAFSGVKVYDDRPALTYSLDALDRGIRIELGVMGIDIASTNIKPEEFKQAEKKAKDNLEKDANHYLNLMSGESNKVDKHDKEKEVKRGAADKDTFNDMKKATLKEEVEVQEEVVEELSIKERLTEKLSNPTLLKAVKQIKAMHPEVTSGIIDDFIDMHGQDILDGADPMDEFHNYIDANYETAADFRDVDEAAKETNFSSDEIKTVSFPNGLKVTVGEPHPEEDGVVNFIRKGQNGYEIGFLDGSEGGSYAVDFNGEFLDEDDYIEEKKGDLNERTDIVPTAELKASDAFRDAGIDMNEPVLVLTQDGGHGPQEVKGTVSAQEALKMFQRLRAEGMKEGREDHYEFDNEIDFHAEGYEYKLSYFEEESTTTALMQKATVSEKKGKDHDGDGDIDSDDYMMAKDKAIKKAMGKDESYAMKRMQQAHTQDRLAGKKSTYDQAKEKQKDQEKQLKEAIKSIIKKTLLNEAATVKLADWAESYETFPGVKPVVNELENIVTEIETFYDKMSDKIKNVFEKTAGFENEEGLKIGGFIAPGLESAFRQDLSKVIKKGSFFNKIDLPKVRTITQADVDAHNSGERPLGETDVTEEPKSTVFTPNF